MSAFGYEDITRELQDLESKILHLGGDVDKVKSRVRICLDNVQFKITTECNKAIELMSQVAGSDQIKEDHASDLRDQARRLKFMLENLKNEVS